MQENKKIAFKQCGLEIEISDIEYVKSIVQDYSALPRTEIAHTICEHWGWVTASGTNKTEACLKLLKRLEDLGELQLPAKRSQRTWTSTRPKWTEKTNFCDGITGSLKDLGALHLRAVTDLKDKALWNEYVDRYHYLGYKRPFGYRLRYFIETQQGRLLGCMLFAGAAKSIGIRDKWIGWDEGQRLNNLAWVINQSRYLILPWVKVRNLASHVLGMAIRRVKFDWQERWGYCPVLIESFVGPEYEGACYKAAGFEYLGMTTGKGFVRPGKSYKTKSRKVFVKPLSADFRFILCSEKLTGVRSSWIK